MQGVNSVWIIAGLIALTVMFLMAVLARMYRKAGPHEALIVYGLRGTQNCSRAAAR